MSQPLPTPKCNAEGCDKPVYVDGDLEINYCLEHCTTPIMSPVSEQSDEEVEVIVERKRDASPKRPRTPRQKRGPLRCPPAPRKAGPARSVSMPQLPYQPGEEMLFPRQRLTKKCACGGDLKITDMDMGRYRGTVITCNWYCGFVINRTLPKYVMAPKVINWGPEALFGRLEAAFPALKN